MQTQNNLKTHVVFILDKSGSMASIRAEAIYHFNEQIEQVQKDTQENMETSVSLITFNHNVSIDYFNKPVSALKPITIKSYTPNGSTAMYDAVGVAIKKLEELDDINDENTAILCIILSDGMENSSQKFSRADIAENIQRLKETERWTFTYLGANQDLSQLADELNLDAGNVQAFIADSDGMQRATEQSTTSTHRYMRSRSVGETFSTNFYTPDE